MKYLNGALALLLVLGVAFGAVACQSTDEEEHPADEEHLTGEEEHEATHLEHFTITGMECSMGCVGVVSDALRDKVQGVSDVEIEFGGVEGSVAVVTGESELSRDEIRDAVTGAGFEVVFPEEKEKDHEDVNGEDHDHDHDNDHDHDVEDDEE